MNIRHTFKLFSLLIMVLALLMGLIGLGTLLVFEVGLADDRRGEWSLLISAGIGLVCGGLLWWFTRTDDQRFGRREALLLVGVSWLAGAALAALPFFLWAYVDLALAGHEAGHPFENPVNCYFEAMSGLTTTGATILADIPQVPPSLLLWRAMTHWLGGLGIVVLFVAVLPMLGAGGKKMFRVEAPGPAPEGVRPQIRETARVLWMLYLGLTVAEIIALRLAGVPTWYEAVCHTFATLATGGFSTHNASIGAYNSLAVEVVTIVFMFLAGVNFGLYYQMIRGNFRMTWRDTELRVYVICLLVGSLLIGLTIYGTTITTTRGEQLQATSGVAARQAVFQMVSIQTTTGFCTGDFNQWPFLAQAVLIVAMFIGASAGSTGGGLKIVRIWITLTVLWAELERAFRPTVVRTIKIGRLPVDDDMRLSVIGYVLGVILLTGAGGVLVMLFEPADTISFKTAGTAAVATIFNIGPGLGKVGAIENYGFFTSGSKLVLSLLMAIGRLEVFAIAVLFFPRFWRPY